MPSSMPRSEIRPPRRNCDCQLATWHSWLRPLRQARENLDNAICTISLRIFSNWWPRWQDCYRVERCLWTRRRTYIRPWRCLWEWTSRWVRYAILHQWYLHMVRARTQEVRNSKHQCQQPVDSMRFRSLLKLLRCFPALQRLAAMTLRTNLLSSSGLATY